MKKLMNKLEKVTGVDLDGDGTVGGTSNANRNGYGGYQGSGYQGYTNQMPVAAATPAQNGLPPGWEAKFDPNSGRTFYVNHQTQKTQWDHPGHSAPPPPAAAAASGGGAAPKFCSNCGQRLTPGSRFCEHCGTKVEAPAQSGGHAAGGGSYGQAVPQAAAAQNFQPSGRRKALLIGLNYRGTSAELRGCINDVHAMRDLLSREGFRDMQVLTDDQRGPNCPTRNNILRACQQLVAGAQPGDVFFFHYSGHGAQQRDPSGREADGYNETIVPADYNSGGGQIIDDELFRTLVMPLPNGCKLTALMDCCHAGTGLDLAYTWEQQRWFIEANPEPHARADVQLFSGCQDDQTSADGDRLGQHQQMTGGAMTAAFIRAYQSAPMQTYPDFIARVRSELRARGFSQYPNLSSSQPFNVRENVFSITQGAIVPNMNPPRHGQFPVKPWKPSPIASGPFAGMGMMEGAMALGGAMLLMNLFD